MLVNCSAFKEYADQIAEIAKNSFSDPWSYESFISLAENGEDYVRFFIEKDAAGSVAGYLVFSITSDEAEILDIAVRADKRGSGIGKRLIFEAFDYGADNGVSAVYLEVRESNSPAIALYEKTGFVPCGRRKQYYEKPVEDAIIMKKERRSNEY